MGTIPADGPHRSCRTLGSRAADQAPGRAPWQRLYFLPEPHGHSSLRPGSEPTTWPADGRLLAACPPGLAATARGWLPLAAGRPPAPRSAGGGASCTITGVSPR